MAEDSKSQGAPKGWREKLGMKSDLPKLADEFQPRPAERPRPVSEPAGAGQERRPAPPAAARPAPPQAPAPSSQPPRPASVGTPVRQPAPMAPRPGSAPPAPRRPGPAAHNGQPAPESEPQRREPITAPPPERPQAARPVSDAFAERLRAQREAAERLAQQRHSEARAVRHDTRMPRPETAARAEPVMRQEPPLRSAPPSRPEPAARPEPTPRPEPEAEAPRFTLAPEEIDAARGETGDNTPPPPRRVEPRAPAPGGYRPPQMRPMAPGEYAPPPTYRPSDRFRSAPGEYQPDDSGDYAPPPPPRRMPPRDDYDRRGPTSPELRGERLPPPPLPPRRDPHIHDDLDDMMFEDDEVAARPAPASRRASVEDYSAAYRGFEDEMEEERPRRRSGPLILVLALLLVAVIAGALVYYKSPFTSTASNPPGELPVITAPKEPAKVAPEPEPQQAQPSQPQGRKQIYDRILGEETLEPERIAPTEEQPAMPQGTEQGTDSLPLPLPPPSGSNGQQGAVDPGGGSTTGVAQTDGSAPKSAADSVIVAEPVSQTAAASSADNAADLSGLPVPGQLDGNDTAAGNSTTADTGTTTLQDAPQTTDGSGAATTAVPTPRPKPVEIAALARAQQQTASEPVRQVEAAPQPTAPATNSSQSSGEGPVMLAPQTGQTAPAQEQQSGGFLSSILQPGGTTEHTTVGGRTSDDPLSGTRPGVNQSTVLVQPEAQPQPQPSAPATANTESQIAALPQPQAPAAPAPSTSSGGSGYVVQLASFKTEGEAINEFQRVRSRYPNLISGLSSQVTEADLGAAGKFYRLGVGPVGSREAASKLCNSLIAAGEKDCLVRRQ